MKANHIFRCEGGRVVQRRGRLSRLELMIRVRPDPRVHVGHPVRPIVLHRRAQVVRVGGEVGIEVGAPGACVLHARRGRRKAKRRLRLARPGPNATDQGEPGGVVGAVLNRRPKDHRAVEPRRALGCYRGARGIGCGHDLENGAGRVEGRLDLPPRVRAEEQAALGERRGVRSDDAKILNGTALHADERVHDRQRAGVDDANGMRRQQGANAGDLANHAVLDRQHCRVGSAVRKRGKHVGERQAGHQRRLFTAPRPRGLLGERSCDALIAADMDRVSHGCAPVPPRFLR